MSAMQTTETFIDGVIEGTYSWTELEKERARWEYSDGSLEFHEWLGLSWDEYRILGSGDDYITAIIKSRNTGQSLASSVFWYATVRPEQDGEVDAEKVQDLIRIVSQ